MKSAVAIVVDGVLRKADHQPIPEGLRLYRTLAPMFNLLLLANADNTDYRHAVNAFCESERLTEHSKLVLPNPVATDLVDARVMQCIYLRNSGLALDYIVEPDEVAARWLVDSGFNVMRFMHAQYVRPEWRPGYVNHVQPWDEIAGQTR